MGNSDRSHENINSLCLNSLSDFNICHSEPDGHCFLHSVISSYNSMCNVSGKIDLDMLIDMIKREVIVNNHKYVPGIQDQCVNILRSEMHQYTDERIYTTSFGDIVPVIVANVLKTNMRIITSLSNNGTSSTIIACDSPNSKKSSLRIDLSRGGHQK